MSALKRHGVNIYENSHWRLGKERLIMEQDHITTRRGCIVIPVFLLVADLVPIIPIMTVVNYSVQDYVSETISFSGPVQNGFRMFCTSERFWDALWPQYSVLIYHPVP